ncbi:MAG: glycosyl hydrolase family 95 catalytic domain-containing protein [Bullifex sp.]
MNNILKFRNQATGWNDGLPVGSGRLAAMLWEDGDDEVISLNNENIWTGEYKNREYDRGDHFLPYVRDYLLRGENFRATALAAVAFGGNGGISPLLRHMDSYQPAFDFVISGLGKFSERRLNMENATAESQRGDVTVSALCHSTDDRAFIKLQGEKPFSFTLSCRRDSQKGHSASFSFSGNEMSMHADLGPGVSFSSRAAWSTDGKVTADSKGISVTEATYFHIICDIVTIYESGDLSSLTLPQNTETWIESHNKHFSSIFSKAHIELEGNGSHEEFIEDRMERLRNGEHDPEMIALFARYGIYLFLAGSVTASLPLNLQGKWNHVSFPKWNSDYHLNINLQMNYWFAESLGFDEYSKQMTDYILSLVPEGRTAAQKLYGCRGIMLGLNSDFFRKISPEAYNYAVWIGAAGWLCTHFWKHWLQTGDMGYLKDQAYPFIKEAAVFYEDYLVTDSEGNVLIMPSQSPENRYEGCGYFPVSMCINSAMDKQICRDTLTIAVKASEILGLDTKEAEKWKALLEGIPECGIGSDGRLLEWDSDDKVEIEKGHRHVSHLYGVYPSSQFTPERDTDKYNAARKSLDYRLAHDGGYTGWSLAWGACLFARFLDGDSVAGNIERLIANLASGSLLDLHPDFFPQKERPLKGKDDPFLFGAPKNMTEKVFQIDGNLGAVAAVIESLIQCRDDVIYLLPARASSWKSGSIGPIRLDDGNSVSFSFTDNRIDNLSITFGWRERASLFLGNTIQTFSGRKGSTLRLI